MPCESALPIHLFILVELNEISYSVCRLIVFYDALNAFESYWDEAEEIVVQKSKVA